MLSNLPPEVKAQLRFISENELDANPFQMAMVETGLPGGLHARLAARSDAIVGIVDTEQGKPIALWRLVAERALCVNTTAAGGNASLMTLGL